MAWKRYECPKYPGLTLYGAGGAKHFQGGVFVTDDEAKQAAIEGHRYYGREIFKTRESEFREAVTITPILPPIDRSAAAPEVDIDPSTGSVKIKPRLQPAKGKRPSEIIAALEEQQRKPELTPEQRIRTAFLRAGYKPGTDLDAVLPELGIDVENLSPIEVADAVEQKLASAAVDSTREPEAAAPPEPDQEVGEVAGSEEPSRTAIRRANHDALVQMAKEHQVDILPIMASPKLIRSKLLKHFHDIEE